MVDGRTEKPRPDITPDGSMVPSDGGQGREEDFKRCDVSDGVSGGGEAGPSKKSARFGSGNDHQDSKEVEKAGQQEMGGRDAQGGTAVCVANESGPAIDCGSGPSIDRGRRTSAVDQVLLDQDLLGGVISCLLGGHARQDVRVLGPLSLVCRTWREVAAWEAWWDRIEAEMLPGVRADWGLWGARSRIHVAHYGFLVNVFRDVARAQEAPGKEWLQRLEAHVEIFDSMDGLQMLSMGGPIELDEDGTCELAEGEESFVTMHVPSKSAVVYSNTPFSAASRDPLGRFVDMAEYFQRGHEEQFPCCLRIRVTLRDVATGRVFTVCNEGKSTERYADDAVWEEEAGALWVAEEFRRAHVLAGLVRPATWFTLVPVAGQGGDVSAQDRLYRVDPHRPSGFKLFFEKLHAGLWDTRSSELGEVALQSALSYTGNAYGEAWLHRLEAHVEVFDRMDGLQMLSLRGAITMELADPPLVDLFIPFESALVRSSTPFSAASRDPEGRFSTISEYFSRGHEEEYPCCLCIRVTVRERETGKTALIYDERKSTQRVVKHDVILERQAGYEVLMVKSDLVVSAYCSDISSSNKGAIDMVGGLRPGDMFYVVPVSGQGDDVSEQDRLYRLSLSYEAGFTLCLRQEWWSGEGASLEEICAALHGALRRAEE